MNFEPDPVTGVVCVRAENCDRRESETHYWRDVAGISGDLILIPSRLSNDDDISARLSFNASVPGGTYRLMGMIQYQDEIAWRWLAIDPDQSLHDFVRSRMDLANGTHRITILGITGFSEYDFGAGIIKIAIVPDGYTLTDGDIIETVADNDGTPTMISPASFEKHAYPSERFTWAHNNSGATDYKIDVGTAKGLSDYLSTPELGNRHYYLFEHSPLNGAFLYIRLHYKIGSTWGYNDHVIQSPRGPALTARYYSTWLQNTNRDPHRILLIEIDHNEGTIYLASKPWLSDENIAYDDFITSSPFMEYSLEDAINVGDIEATNPIVDEDWLNNQYSGFKCRWYFGDTRWRKSDFRQIASAVVDRCRWIGNRVYRFELSSDVQEYSRQISTTEQMLNMDVQQAIAWIFDQYEYSGSYRFVNVSNNDLYKNLQFKVDETTNAYSLVREIARSIGADTRPAETGYLEIFKTDDLNSPVVVLNDDSISDGSVRLVNTTPPVQRVIVNYAMGEQSTTVLTGYQVGAFDDEITFESLLADESDAVALANDLAQQYSVRQDIWEIGVTSLDSVISVGQSVEVNHSQLMQSGRIERIRRTPLSTVSLVEIKTS